MFLKYFVLSLIIALLFFGETAGATDSYSVNAGQTITIDEFGVCKDVTNSLGVGIMVPTKTADEWHTGGISFLENLYAGVSAADCPLTCAGTLVGGYCWYAGPNVGSFGTPKSCTQVCLSYGGVDMVGTKDYAGSSGTDAQCKSVLTALGLGSGNLWFLSASNMGCYLSGTRRYRNTATTTAGAASGIGSRRACACNN